MLTIVLIIQNGLFVAQRKGLANREAFDDLFDGSA